VGRSCVFCGSTDKLTSEHATPAWLTDVLPGVDGGTITHARGGQRTSDPLRRWTSKAVAFKVRYVCESCNTGWMARLEEAVIPLLTPMIRGEPSETRERVRLKPSQQQLLAFWLVKTVAMLDLTSGEGIVPMGELQWLYLHRRKRVPPPRTWVWLAAYTGPANTSSFQSGTVVPDGASDHSQPQGYQATMSIGHVVFQVVSVSEPSWDFNGQADAEVSNLVDRIWPNPTITRRWPRFRNMTGPELAAFAGDDSGWWPTPPTSDEAAETWEKAWMKRESLTDA
jgi:hypothetical protein